MPIAICFILESLFGGEIMSRDPCSLLHRCAIYTNEKGLKKYFDKEYYEVLEISEYEVDLLKRKKGDCAPDLNSHKKDKMEIVVVTILNTEREFEQITIEESELVIQYGERKSSEIDPKKTIYVKNKSELMGVLRVLNYFFDNELYGYYEAVFREIMLGLQDTDINHAYLKVTTEDLFKKELIKFFERIKIPSNSWCCLSIKRDSDTGLSSLIQITEWFSEVADNYIDKDGPDVYMTYAYDKASMYDLPL